jgi:electron transport complex protein RnfG
VNGSPGSVRLVTTLALAGLLSGLTIVGTYEATLPRITENQARALRRAIFEVVPGANVFQPLELVEGELGVAGEATDLFAVYDGSGSFVGYAITGEGPGFQDTIGLIFGFDPAREQVVGMQVLESRETPGLGDRIFKDPEFVASFRSLATQPEIVLVPKGSGTAPHEVDGITGATISSKAVVKILNASIARWSASLPEPGAEPPPPPTSPSEPEA